MYENIFELLGRGNSPDPSVWARLGGLLFLKRAIELEVDFGDLDEAYIEKFAEITSARWYFNKDYGQEIKDAARYQKLKDNINALSKEFKKDKVYKNSRQASLVHVLARLEIVKERSVDQLLQMLSSISDRADYPSVLFNIMSSLNQDAYELSYYGGTSFSSDEKSLILSLSKDHNINYKQFRTFSALVKELIKETEAMEFESRVDLSMGYRNVIASINKEGQSFSSSKYAGQKQPEIAALGLSAQNAQDSLSNTRQPKQRSI